MEQRTQAAARRESANAKPTYPSHFNTCGVAVLHHLFEGWKGRGIDERRAVPGVEARVVQAHTRAARLPPIVHADATKANIRERHPIGGVSARPLSRPNVDGSATMMPANEVILIFGDTEEFKN